MHFEVRVQLYALRSLGKPSCTYWIKCMCTIPSLHYNPFIYCMYLLPSPHFPHCMNCMYSIISLHSTHCMYTLPYLSSTHGMYSCTVCTQYYHLYTLILALELLIGFKAYICRIVAANKKLFRFSLTTQNILIKSIADLPKPVQHSLLYDW